MPLSATQEARFVGAIDVGAPVPGSTDDASKLLERAIEDALSGYRDTHDCIGDAWIFTSTAQRAAEAASLRAGTDNSLEL